MGFLMNIIRNEDFAELEARPYWPHLQSKAGRPVLEAIQSAWEQLINKDDAKEVEYQEFLRQHAGFFFGKRAEMVLVLSKIRLGSQYETDFVVCTDNRSQGLSYNFIELEVPHTGPYTKEGNPHTRLTHAIQQVEDWRLWIEANREEAKRLFPSPGFIDRDVPNFEFIVVIGTRENSERWLHKRNAWAQRQNLQIRSFD